MKFLFEDESFSFETLRTAGFAAYGGADLGEVLATAGDIGEGDEASWHRAWKATALRVAEIGEQALAAGHRVSAREALLRASKILDPENDQYLKGQPQLVEKALTGASTTLVTLTEQEGAGEHTHAGGLGRAHQTMFDWLDAVLAPSPEPEQWPPYELGFGGT
jgi:hypothetical protein